MYHIHDIQKALPYANSRATEHCCCFAPEGRDVYRPAVTLTPQLRRSATAFTRLGKGSADRFRSYRSENPSACALAINISLLWSENEFNS